VSRADDSSVDRDARAVEDILEFCRQAARLVARGPEAFQRDEMLALAGEALISRVGEAAARLSPEFRERRPAVPWRDIRGMRNLVAHDYGRIDNRIFWNTLRRDLPALAQQLEGT
jgi:uncharacterized protein with HEPN domain